MFAVYLNTTRCCAVLGHASNDDGSFDSLFLVTQSFQNHEHDQNRGILSVTFQRPTEKE